MRRHLILFAIIAGLITGNHRANGADNLVALSGQISSPQEGAMEGVLISAQKAGSPITITVVSDQNGHYSFPAAKLESGRYDLHIRATGYEVDGPHRVDVSAQNPAQADLTLRKTKDLASQLTNTEWFISMPGTPEQKRPLIECMSCHTFERVLRSTYTAEEFFPILKRMTQYAHNSTIERPQPRVEQRRVSDEQLRKLAEYLASINLSHGAPWPYELKILPRPKGNATHVTITEYDLPRKTIAPHDVIVDKAGTVWYSNFVENFLGKVDPRTGEHTEYPYPALKPNAPAGALALESDQDGNLWLALEFQTGIAKFNVNTNQFKIFAVPPDMNDGATQQTLVMPGQSHVDGKVWVTDVGTRSILRFDIATGSVEKFDVFKTAPKNRPHLPYGLAADTENNLYFMDFGDEGIGKVEAKTGRIILYQTPTPYSRPRRTMLDRQDRLWFAEFAANKIGMFDIKRETFKEWDAPTPHTYPYDVFLDKNNELWSGSMSSDRILRFDPERGTSLEYLLPRSTNLRRIFVDNSTNPVTVWVGNNHGASIIKLEPTE